MENEEEVVINGVPPTEVGPDGETVVNGPHASTTVVDGQVQDVNVGLASVPIGENGSADVMAAEANFGNGETTFGAQGEVALASAELAPNEVIPYVGGEVGAGTASGGAYIGEESAQIGAEANLIEGSVAVGTEANHVQIGGAVGVGFGGRAHYGDADEDGTGELGFGVDAGPVSFDVRTEAPHAVANKAGEVAGGVGEAVGDFFSW